jgi:hypothetical protein
MNIDLFKTTIISFIQNNDFTNKNIYFNNQYNITYIENYIINENINKYIFYIKHMNDTYEISVFRELIETYAEIQYEPYKYYFDVNKIE